MAHNNSRSRGHCTRRIAIPLTVALSLMAAACGGDDDKGASSTAAPASSAATPGSSATSSAGSTDSTTAGSGGATDSTAGSTAAGTTDGECKLVKGEGVDGEAVHADTLTVAAQVPATSLNPSKINTAFITYTSLAYDSLTYRAADGTIEPALAESWKYLDDKNQQFELTIRDGVKFTDGSAVDAKAVAASLNYSKGVGTSPYVVDWESVEATGPMTVVIKTKNPNPALAQLLAPKSGIGQIISPTGLANPDALTPENPSQGAGAYILSPKDTVAGLKYVYTANPDYYNKCRQHYDKIVLQVITDPQAALNALKTKQIDAMIGDTKNHDQAVSAKLQVVTVPLTWKGLNLIDREGKLSKPLGDVKVRQAINYAIDRDTIAKALLGDVGWPTSMITMPDGEGWTKETAEMYKYNPDKAKELLKEAGYPDGFEMSVQSIHLLELDTLAEAIKANLEEVGIKLQLDHAADEQTYAQGVLGAKHPAFTAVFGVQPMFIMGPNLFLPTAKFFNPMASSNAEVIDLYNQFAVASTKDQPAIAVKIQNVLAEQAWFAPVILTPFLVFAKTDLGGVHLSPGSPTPEVLDWYNTK